MSSKIAGVCSDALHQQMRIGRMVEHVDRLVRRQGCARQSFDLAAGAGVNNELVVTWKDVYGVLAINWRTKRSRLGQAPPQQSGLRPSADLVCLET